MATPIATDPRSAPRYDPPVYASLVAGLDARGRSVVRELRGTPPLGLRELRRSAGGPVRVAIVQTAAFLVGGDDVQLSVRVENGAALVLTDISATLAHPGLPARQRIDLEVCDDAFLVFAEQPLIVAAGAELERRVTLTLGSGSRAIHRDTLVLGRHGEQSGAARIRLRVQRGAMPVLDETLDTGDRATLTSAAVLGGARVLGALGRYGIAGPLPAGAFALNAEDTLVRRISATTRDLRELDELQNDWTTALASPLLSGARYAASHQFAS